jgi:hypothetical protein
MRLMLDLFDLDTKGLPRVFSLRVTPSRTGDRPTTVSILLDSCQRAAVAKWAARLGVEVVDLKPFRSRPDSRWTHTFEAVREVDGFRVRVWTSVDLDAPAEPIEDSATGETALHWPARGLDTTTLCQGEPLTREVFAGRESDVTCPHCRALLTPEPTGGAS